MKLPRPRRLNEHGFSWHFVLPILVVLAVVVVGHQLLRKSHADTVPDLSTVNTTVTVAPRRVVAAIPSRYLGLSFETSALCNLTGAWNTPVFQQLVKNLGPQVIRVGGNSSSEALWSPTGTAVCNGTNGGTKTVLNQQLVSSFFTVAHALNAKVMWTVNLGNYAPSTYSNEAAYVAKTGQQVGGNNGSFLWALGTGNEPDLFHNTKDATGNLIRPANWPLTGGGGDGSFISAWNTYRDTIRQATGRGKLKFMGPDVADNDAWFTTFVNDEQADLSHATHHYYAIHTSTSPYNLNNPLNENSSLHLVPGCKNTSPSSTQDAISQCFRDVLLSKQLMAQAAQTVGAWKQDAAHVPLAIDEANSVTGGEAGSSDTFASALWGLDFLYTSLKNGATQVNLHDTGGSPYTPIAFNHSGQATAQALYYGMLAFHYAAGAGTLVSTSTSSPYNVTAYGVSDNGKLSVTVINKDAHVAVVKVNPGTSYSNATTLALIAPSADATVSQGQIALGGSQVTTEGSWKPASTPIHSVAGVWAVKVPADSAMTVTFNP